MRLGVVKVLEVEGANFTNEIIGDLSLFSGKIRFYSSGNKVVLPPVKGNLDISVHETGSTLDLAGVSRFGHIRIIAKNAGCVVLGERTTVENAYFLADKSNIKIGRDCMISFSISFRTTDAHGIYNVETGERLNEEGPIVIGDHVWVGQNVIVSKNVTVESGSIIESSSFLSNSDYGPNSIFAGTPAKKIREHVTWDRRQSSNLFASDANIDPYFKGNMLDLIGVAHPLASPATNEALLTTTHDFSLKSGERQFAATLTDIRGDHVNRYAFGLKHLETAGFGLDVFCGNGYGSYMAAQEGHHMLAMDASAEALAVANENYAADTVYFARKLWPFDLPAETFDFCFCLESIEHVQNGGAFLNAIYKALKPGGILILSTPNQDLMPFVPEQHKFHIRHYTEKESFDLLKQRKMEVITWGGQDVYDIHKNGTHTLKDPDARVIPETAGQFLIMIARK